MLQNVYRGHTIIVEEIEAQKQIEEKQKLEKDVGSFVKAVVDNLTARFPSSEIIQAVKMFDPKAQTWIVQCMEKMISRYSLHIIHRS